MRRIEVLSGVTVLALGFLLAVPAICATEPPEVGTNGNVMGSLESWADHGLATDTPETLFKSSHNIAISPGGNGVPDSRVQLGLSQSDHAQFYLQYDDDPGSPGQRPRLKQIVTT